jgi:hypothetical protein
MTSSTNDILETWPEEPDPATLSRLVDTHAHPTDYKRFSDDPDYRAAADSLHLNKVSPSSCGHQVQLLASDRLMYVRSSYVR